MIDRKHLRQFPEVFLHAFRSRGVDCDLQSLLTLDGEVLKLQKKMEGKRNQQKLLSKGQPRLEEQEKLSHLKREIGEICTELLEKEGHLTTILASLPNLPLEGIPNSLSTDDNEMIRQWSKPPLFSFEPRHHLALNDKHHLFDLEKGAKLTGAGWPLYRGMGARLEWALIQWMLDSHISSGFEMWMPPLLADRETLYASAHLPKFRNQLYCVPEESTDYYLIPSAETVLNAIHRGDILEEADLPKRYVAYTPCFRREAGAAGKGERGLIRTHQFNKVELFCFSSPENSLNMLDEMVAIAESLLVDLELHHRTMLLVTGDLPFAAAKAIDIEVWLPGQDRYYEVSSLSNCTDFQARRSHIRYRPAGGKPLPLHTLNGSGLATSRLFVALMENHQREDGSIYIPEPLRLYLGGKSELKP
ncbi:MAG: serine--tRNA ligase [Chlamydiota bacterium]|nr:serine--tRNA ligase [Chlamydiota bacterium]